MNNRVGADPYYPYLSILRGRNCVTHRGPNTVCPPSTIRWISKDAESVTRSATTKSEWSPSTTHPDCFRFKSSWPSATCKPVPSRHSLTEISHCLPSCTPTLQVQRHRRAMDVHSERRHSGPAGPEGSGKDLVARIAASSSIAQQRRFQQRYRHTLGAESFRSQTAARHVTFFSYSIN